MNIKKIIIENQSVASTLVEACNNAIENAGYNAYFDDFGNIEYCDKEACESQDKIYSAYSQDPDVQSVVDETRI